MEDEDIVQRYKLNVSVLGDRNHEILRAPTEGRWREHGTVTKIWERRHALAQHVYLEESQFGELRAIKQVHWRDFKSDQTFFVQFFGWFLTQDYVSFAMEYCPLGDVSQCFETPVSEVMARDMCEKLLEGLGKLHEMGSPTEISSLRIY
ncbi:uncharacterized protein ASPGLDRAFT_83644 [Aspergillus glaucus CBS 516.65]|uniref:Protein kinase domain-containing protein n=1 Tax=Aspergillus glaucus CBS 516.65 TaxID=1160497 RepID=A0A1L9VET6_ASPGL|nr:hypothetical protein ASPGLDRAFT_83644 [Aspergillus glaucus CBS 516.65]OJJ82471.1 hypothetical protein ASPGLDRAFT_83644 [Aspergillus glaucus CBS 516.65]